MPAAVAVPAIASVASAGIGAVGSALSGRKGGSQSQSGSSIPLVSQEMIPLRDNLIAMAMSRLRGDQDMSGYIANGTSNINDTFDASRMARENMLSARGLASSPIAANADIMGENARSSDIAQLRNSAPLMQRDFQNQDFQNALGLFSKTLGTKTAGSGTSTLPGTTSGETLGGIGNILAYFTGKGLFGQGSSPASSQQSDGLAAYNAALMNGSF